MKKVFQGERDDSPIRVNLRENKSRRDIVNMYYF